MAETSEQWTQEGHRTVFVSCSSLSEVGHGSLAPPMAVGENGFSAVGNHPMAAQKWNHNLAETAIGWS